MGERFVPHSVRYGNRRTRLRWWFGNVRENVALWLAPWLGSSFGRPIPNDTVYVPRIVGPDGEEPDTTSDHPEAQSGS